MKASSIRVSDLPDWMACNDAIESIESDYLNFIGGLTAWHSGRETHLTVSAKKKISAIQRRMDRFPDEEVY